jgi:hypothetical protein
MLVEPAGVGEEIPARFDEPPHAASTKVNAMTAVSLITLLDTDGTEAEKLGGPQRPRR